MRLLFLGVEFANVVTVQWLHDADPRAQAMPVAPGAQLDFSPTRLARRPLWPASRSRRAMNVGIHGDFDVLVSR
jgi:hypothetical protein